MYIKVPSRIQRKWAPATFKCTTIKNNEQINYKPNSPKKSKPGVRMVMYAVLPAYITTVLINYGKNNYTEIKATYHEYSHFLLKFRDKHY